MSGATMAERPPRLFVDPPRKLGSAGVRRPSDSSGGGGLTLEQRLDGVWEGLCADGAAECPLCRGRMARAAGEGCATCADCGSSLG
ncbi:MAG: hypothetical protein WKF32_06240 [Thermoleophilaceae bacterium]